EPLDAAATASAFSALATRIEQSTGESRAADELAAGFLKIAIERMANAIKQISVQRGHDVTRFALCCFGGAGGQHAAQVADALGVRTVLIHPLAGVLSAYGIGVADLRVVQQSSVEETLDAALLAGLADRFDALAAAARDELRAQDGDASQATVACRVRLKVAGADTSLAVAWQLEATIAELRRAFDEQHARHFGFRADANAVLVAESLELEAVVPSGSEPVRPAPLARASGPPKKIGTRSMWCGDGRHDVA